MTHGRMTARSVRNNPAATGIRLFRQSLVKAMPLHTPDGRYIIVRERLWRAANPHLPAKRRADYVARLMAARRAVKAALSAKDSNAERVARDDVDRVKTLLGERGPVWWSDGSPDLNRKMVRNTPYAEWYDTL